MSATDDVVANVDVEDQMTMKKKMSKMMSRGSN